MKHDISNQKDHANFFGRHILGLFNDVDTGPRVVLDFFRCWNTGYGFSIIFCVLLRRMVAGVAVG